MALTTFTAGQVLTAAQVNAVQANDYNQTVSTKVASYVLVAADKGTRVVMDASGATTITVNTSLFNAGDTLFIQNIGAGVCTITAGTATVSTAGSLALAQFGGGTLYFTSAGVAVFFSVIGLSRATYSATTGSPTITTPSGKTALKFTGSGSITINKAGLVDVLVVAGGGSCAITNFAGGAGGYVNNTDLYLLAGTYTLTVGAAGGVTTFGNDSAISGKTTAVGGGQGQNNIARATIRGGSAGGSNIAQSGTNVIGQGNIGGNGTAAGGGGSSGAGGDTGAAGAGTSNSITGTAVTYATGGASGGDSGAANTGNGAGGLNTTRQGGSGVIVVLVG